MSIWPLYESCAWNNCIVWKERKMRAQGVRAATLLKMITQMQDRERQINKTAPANQARRMGHVNCTYNFRVPLTQCPSCATRVFVLLLFRFCVLLQINLMTFCTIPV